MNIAIIGNGWVGKAMQELFPNASVYVRKVIGNNVDSSGKIIGNYYTNSKDKINEADIAFICVPTPLLESGKLDTSIVEECIQWLETDIIVVRSTVNPGDCDNWTTKYGKKIVFQPEYLGETPSHPLLNENHTPFIILGGWKEHTRKIVELYTKVYNANVKIRQVSLYEAELIKLTENRAIAFKVMQCHELYLACEKAGVDYYTIRDAVYGDDPRFDLWFTMIYPGNLGFNSSKCLRKDVPAWSAWAKSIGFNPEITSMLVIKSGEYGRT